MLNAIRIALGLSLFGAAPAARADATQTPTVEVRDARLVDDFIGALELYGQGLEAVPARPEIKMWLDGLRARGVDPTFLQRRLDRAKERAELESADPFARYRRIRVETYPTTDETERAVPAMALHAVRFDVIEDYDDTFNDDIYCYFITTHDDQVWGKVTSIYRGLDEGSSFFFTPEDRGLFGPTGDTLVPKNHTIVDFGIIESDGGDVEQLQKLSHTIVDIALVALSVYDPNAGAAAAQARAETKNLFDLIIGMDDDDRLIADTLAFTPDSMVDLLGESTFQDISRTYDHETFWTHFTYRLGFRLLR